MHTHSKIPELCLVKIVFLARLGLLELRHQDTSKNKIQRTHFNPTFTFIHHPFFLAGQ